MNKEAFLQQLAWLLLTAVAGTTVQLILFKTSSNSFTDAMGTHQWLWVLYTFCSLFVVESYWRRLRKREK